ncbi:MAG: BatA and WFA domain-containing protein [Planctomycetota bacterium]|nr:BatA and WFA domain-containing protein [Planctomycetota bacterium]
MSWFTTPWGLLGFLAVPAVVALHLFHRKHQNFPVAGLFLWEDAQFAETAGARRQPLRRTPSFWLEVLAALLAGLWLSGFDPWGNGKTEHLVVVLDDSASMRAMHASEGSPQEKAIRYLSDELQEKGRRIRTTLVRSGLRPTLLAGPGALTPDVLRATEKWAPQAPAHNLKPALAFARELAEGGKILLLTDRPLGHPQEDVRVLSFGRPLANQALAKSMRKSLGHGEDEISITVRNYSDNEAATQLTLRHGEQILAQKDLTQPADARTTIQLSIPSRLGAIQVELKADALGVDNQAVLHPIPDRRVNVFFGLSGETHRQLQLSKAENSFSGIRRVSHAADADLVLAHVPANPPSWSLVLPLEENDLEAYAGPFAFEQRHDLLEGLTLEGVVWTSSKDFPTPGTPLVSAGSTALLTEQRLGAAKIWHLNLLPQRSTLQRSPDWPILFSNLIELCSQGKEGPQSINLVCGETFSYHASESADWALEGPDGTRHFTTVGDLHLSVLAPFGFWKLHRDKSLAAIFSVNFVDPSESDLRDRGSLVQASQKENIAPAEARFAESPVGRWILLFFLLAVLADWWVLGRRRP